MLCYHLRGRCSRFKGTLCKSQGDVMIEPKLLLVGSMNFGDHENSTRAKKESDRNLV